MTGTGLSNCLSASYRRGYTLLELLVSLVIIVILLAVGVPLMSALFSGCNPSSATAAPGQLPSWFRGNPPDPRQLLTERLSKLQDQLAALDKNIEDINKELEEIRQRVEQASDTKVIRLASLRQVLLNRQDRVRQELDYHTRKRDLWLTTLEEGRAVLKRVERESRLQEAGLSDEAMTVIMETVRTIDSHLKSAKEAVPNVPR